MSHIGHRSVDGIGSYKWICEDQKKSVSDVLNSVSNGHSEAYCAQERPGSPKKMRLNELSQSQVIIRLLSHNTPWMHARKAGVKVSIIKDWEFDECRKMLNRRAIRHHEEGLSKRKKKADVLTLEEEEELWRRDVLGGITQLAWTTLCFLGHNQQFGTRCQEQYKLHVEDLKFVHDSQGKTM